VEILKTRILGPIMRLVKRKTYFFTDFMTPKIVEKLSTSEIVRNKLKYEHIFGEPQEQKEVTVLFIKMINIRKKLHMLTGGNKTLDPSILAG
jgi:hypothetical protein